MNEKYSLDWRIEQLENTDIEVATKISDISDWLEQDRTPLSSVKYQTITELMFEQYWKHKSWDVRDSALYTLTFVFENYDYLNETTIKMIDDFIFNNYQNLEKYECYCLEDMLLYTKHPDRDKVILYLKDNNLLEDLSLLNTILFI